MPKDNPHSFRQAVLRLVHEQGPISTEMIARALGHLISATNAVQLGRAETRKFKKSYTLEELKKQGVSRKTRHCLKKLAQQGRVRRVSPGVYGPPLPKLFIAV